MLQQAQERQRLEQQQQQQQREQSQLTQHLDALLQEQRQQLQQQAQLQQQQQQLRGELQQLAQRQELVQRLLDLQQLEAEAHQLREHQRELQRLGKAPQFGSFRYTAQDLYDKGILLSIDQFSPRQFDKIDIVISSNKIGVFTIEIFNNALGITNRVAHADVKMEDLLLAQFENRSYFSLLNGVAKFNLNALLFQINKK